jgi:uncharacterized protein YqjF (DUF2071 family)
VRALQPKEILSHTAHRTIGMPEEPWLLYQQWRRVLFFHWHFDAEVISPLLPSGLEIDTIDGRAWISIVLFSVYHTHPRHLPSMAPVSNFDEVNLRTYVVCNSIPGIHFLDIKANNQIQVWLNKTIGLPYRMSRINATSKDYKLKSKNIAADIKYQEGSAIANKTYLDRWLTERYCTYQQTETGLYMYPIHHIEWPLSYIEPKESSIAISYNGLELGRDDIALMHYSKGVDMLAWPREKML